MGLCGGGVAQPLAAVSRRLGQVSGWAERGVDWEGWSFGLFGSLHWLCGLEEVGKPKAQPVSVGQPKPSKIPKIPIALDDSGEFKRLP